MSEQAPYVVERTIEGVELRRYRPMVLATVRDLPDNQAFGILFRYIAGNNRSRRERDQPSRVAAKGEKIAMTAPVFSASDSFSFAMPASYSMESVPEPLDTRSSLEGIPARRVATLRFGGSAGARAVADRSRRLLETLGRHGLRPRGTPFLMRYNSPFTPGFLRRNEVGVELLPADG